MNRYPLWKYILIGIVLLKGLIYTLTNFFVVFISVFYHILFSSSSAYLHLLIVINSADAL